jgi:hypothetical protein
MLPVTAVMIDWSSAVVKPKGCYLELAVRLSTAPDSVWKNEFARISHMTDGLESEPWWANVPDFDVLTVGGIEVGTEAPRQRERARSGTRSPARGSRPSRRRRSLRSR